MRLWTLALMLCAPYASAAIDFDSGMESAWPRDVPKLQLHGRVADARGQTVPSACYASAGPRTYRCSLGKNGVSASKVEGDKKTPVGTFPLRMVLYRPDKLGKPRTGLTAHPMQQDYGWCEKPDQADYNKLVRLPHPCVRDRMWRNDDLYDLIIVVGYNDAPVVPGRGSAIFVHVATADYEGTAGCISFAKADLLQILSQLGPNARVVVSPAGAVAFIN